jgi:Arc/MetJ-type ribon-helix-helix transcriptional regulator
VLRYPRSLTVGMAVGSINGMKLSVSLPEEDVEYLDEYVAEKSVASRSAALHEAIGLLRLSVLESAYEAANAEWESSEDAALWENASADGLGDAAR